MSRSTNSPVRAISSAMITDDPGIPGEKEAGADKRPLLSRVIIARGRTRLINREGSESGRGEPVLLLDQGGRFERFRVARFSFQSRSLLGRLCAHIRVHDPRILETSIFFLADYVLHARSVSVSARQKAAKSEERVWPFFSLFFISFFFSLDASRCVMPLRHIKPRGEDKKKRKKSHGPVAARWLAFKRSSVSKEEHKGRWCQRGELENDEEREREARGRV